jgi:tetratricopeptide (TPR) repeat protein
MKYLDASRTLYVQYNAVNNKPDETIASFSAKLEAFADSHPVDRLALDVRQNSGGNNYYNAPLIRSLLHARLDARGKLFLIIGRSTFSAAQNLVNDLRRLGEPTLVGEPTGSRPNQFGDHDPVVLPHSGLVVMVSTVLWQDGGKQNHAPWTSPDLPAELSFSQYREGFDPAMDAVLRYRSIADALAPALVTGESADIRDRYRAFKSDPSTQWIPTEGDVNALGYRLLGERRAELAETILQLNAESYPRSANAFDSLGEAYFSQGKLEAARESYRKALALAPDSDNARRMLAAIDERIGREGGKDAGKR